MPDKIDSNIFVKKLNELKIELNYFWKKSHSTYSSDRSAPVPSANGPGIAALSI